MPPTIAVYGALMAASIMVGFLLLTNTMLGVQAQQPRLLALMAALGAASLVLVIVSLAGA